VGVAEGENDRGCGTRGTLADQAAASWSASRRRGACRDGQGRARSRPRRPSRAGEVLPTAGARDGDEAPPAAAGFCVSSPPPARAAGGGGPHRRSAGAGARCAAPAGRAPHAAATPTDALRQRDWGERSAPSAAPRHAAVTAGSRGGARAHRAAASPPRAAGGGGSVAAGDSPNRTPFCSGVCCPTDSVADLFGARS